MKKGKLNIASLLTKTKGPSETNDPAYRGKLEHEKRAKSQHHWSTGVEDEERSREKEEVGEGEAEENKNYTSRETTYYRQFFGFFFFPSTLDREKCAS